VLAEDVYPEATDVLGDGQPEYSQLSSLARGARARQARGSLSGSTSTTRPSTGVGSRGGDRLSVLDRQCLDPGRIGRGTMEELEP